MTSTIKVNNIQNQCGANIINENSNTITIGASGDTIALASGASQTGFGRTGTVDWQTSIITAASFTAVNGQGFFVDTSSNTVTANLPAGSVGAIVSFKDYAQNFDTNALTISANGSEKIEGITEDLVLNTKGVAVTLVYGDATKGWQAVNSNEITNVVKFVTASGGTETTSGNFKIHTFTGPGTFTVTCAGSAGGSNTVDYLVVAGGGGGANQHSGGGGAGGLRVSPGTASGCWTASPLGASPAAALALPATSYPITVGGGGAGGAAPVCSGNGINGSNTTFSSITAAGGGGGGDYGSAPGANGTTGGSGGGGGSDSGLGASGNTPSVSPPQGQDGGNGALHNSGGGGGGGGGGAGGAGAAAVAGPSGGAGNGGAGVQINIDTNNYYWSGGGGGGTIQDGANGAGDGGIGGGGGGAASPPASSPKIGAGGGSAINSGAAGAYGACGVGGAGGDNSGGGGGGGASGGGNGGAGGSGVVIIRYRFQA